jgi:serine/threonine-protein kinase
MASDTPATPRAQDDPGARDGAGKERRVVRMGKYEVVQHIATGGMGAVYRARDTESHREVALKVLFPEMAKKPAMLERFKREARSAAKLDHENIVSVHEFGDCNGMWFLAMEYVPGVDLHDHVKKVGPLDPEEARLIILQGARALRHAYEQGVVHRDVKPSNFLLTRRGDRPHVKLTDFGLARELDGDDFRVTRAGTTVGTIDYMSPEQARDSGRADTRSDLYSLGCSWFHLLAGDPPFPKGGLGERLIKIMHDEPPDVRDLNPFVSGECAAIIDKLLRKDPAERYQSAGELIDELLALEGRTAARPGEIRERGKGKKSKTPVPVAAAAKAQPAADASLWPTLAGLAAVLVVGGGLLLAVSMPRRPPVTPVDQPGAGAVSNEATITRNDRALHTPDPPKDKGGPSAPPAPVVKPLPSLSASSRAANVAALNEEVRRPWANAAPVPADALTVTVGRAVKPTRSSFRTIAEACRAGEPGKPLVVEIHDNGPLFELSLGSFEGRDLVIRAGKGYRPLVLWDPGAAAARSGRKAEEPLTFLRMSKGRLFLEGLELALRWPETLGNPAELLAVEEGDLTVTDCTISAAGKPRRGLTVARLRSPRESARVRFTRCQVRGAGLTALDLDAPAAEVLFEGSLVVGGEQPLLRVKAGRSPTKFRVVRSTMLGGPSLLELKPEAGEHLPAFSWLGWDSLLSQPSRVVAGKEATLLAVLDGANTRNVGWRAINCLYAGWKNLLTGGTTVPADAGAWQRHWAGANSDGVAANAWPEQAYTEPATLPASAYQPTGAVLYRATVADDKPLGCDLAALPASRDAWLALALDPTLLAPDLPMDEARPAVPDPMDGKYHGGPIDLTMTDLGAYLAKLQEDRQLGPRVVLHLSGRGEHFTSPIRLKGASLVLHFPEPEMDAEKLTLTLTRTTKPVPLIDLDGGSLEVIGGVLRVPDQGNFQASHVVRVKGGDVRMYQTRLDGPQQSEPVGYEAALALIGSGDPSPEKGRSCALNECVVLSSRAGVALNGVGSRLSLRQCLVVSGTEALHFLPGRGCKGRAAMQAQLTNVTIAARRAVVRLGDAPAAGVPTDPVEVQARACAYLNPFPGRPSKAGMLVWEGDALPRGLLVWQGAKEGFDARLHFAAAAGGISDTKEGYTPWKQIWGDTGVREPREVALVPVFDLRRWQLDRLALKMRDAPGANLERLGITPRKK